MGRMNGYTSFLRPSIASPVGRVPAADVAEGFCNQLLQHATKLVKNSGSDNYVAAMLDIDGILLENAAARLSQCKKNGGQKWCVDGSEANRLAVESQCGLVGYGDNRPSPIKKKATTCPW